MKQIPLYLPSQMRNALGKLGLTFSLLIAFTGCAVNRVEEVKSARDTKSIYKVPVVYGIGIAKDSLPIPSYHIAAIGFAEYDPATKEGTSSCLGHADVMWVSFGVKIPPKTTICTIVF
jgi:hypothetical protein